MPIMSPEVIVDVSGTKSPVKVYYSTADKCVWVEGNAVVQSEDYEYLNGYSRTFDVRYKWRTYM